MNIWFAKEFYKITVGKLLIDYEFINFLPKWKWHVVERELTTISIGTVQYVAMKLFFKITQSALDNSFKPLGDQGKSTL